jgi:hypothetical protein
MHSTGHKKTRCALQHRVYMIDGSISGIAVIASKFNNKIQNHFELPNKKKSRMKMQDECEFRSPKMIL